MNELELFQTQQATPIDSIGKEPAPNMPTKSTDEEMAEKLWTADEVFGPPMRQPGWIETHLRQQYPFRPGDYALPYDLEDPVMRLPYRPMPYPMPYRPNMFPMPNYLDPSTFPSVPPVPEYGHQGLGQKLAGGFGSIMDMIKARASQMKMPKIQLTKTSKGFYPDGSPALDDEGNQIVSKQPVSFRSPIKFQNPIVAGPPERPAIPIAEEDDFDWMEY